MFTRQHYRAVAGILQPYALAERVEGDKSSPLTVDALAVNFAVEFLHDNAQFDVSRFLTEVGIAPNRVPALANEVHELEAIYNVGGRLAHRG